MGRCFEYVYGGMLCLIWMDERCLLIWGCCIVVVRIVCCIEWDDGNCYWVERYKKVYWLVIFSYFEDGSWIVESVEVIMVSCVFYEVDGVCYCLMDL